MGNGHDLSAEWHVMRRRTGGCAAMLSAAAEGCASAAASELWRSTYSREDAANRRTLPSPRATGLPCTRPLHNTS